MLVKTWALQGQYFFNQGLETDCSRTTTGGFLNAAAVNACQQYIDANFGDAYPDIIISYTQFMKRVPTGYCDIKCYPLNRSSAQCVMRVDICSSNGPEAEAVEQFPAVTAILTFGSFAKEHGLTQSTTQLHDLPDFEKDSRPYEGLTYDVMKTYRLRPRKHPGKFWGNGAGGHIRDSYYAYEAGQPMDQLGLTLFADMVSL